MPIELTKNGVDSSFLGRAIFLIILTTKKVKVLTHRSVMFLKQIKIIKKKILMKYIGQCLVNFVGHTYMPDFHSSSLDGKTAPKKIIKFLYLKLNGFKFFCNFLVL